MYRSHHSFLSNRKGAMQALRSCGCNSDLHVPEYRAASKSNRLRDYLGLTPETRIVLYQGYLQPDRGLDRLLRVRLPFLSEIL